MKRERRDLFLLFLLALATRALFLYRDGAPEPDAVAMVAGMAIGMSGNVPLGDALLYGRNVNPGMHWLVAYFFPRFHVPATQLFPVLNWISLVCASLMVIPLYALLRPHFSHRITMAALLAWIMTPVVWESGTYYHPLIPALLLLLVAIVCAQRTAATIRGAIWALLMLLLSCAAFVLRVEVAFVWPAFLVWTLTSARPWRNTISLLVTSAIAATAYVIAAGGVMHATSSETLGIGGYLEMLRGTYSQSMNLRALPRSITWLASGVGVATCAACLAWRNVGAHRRIIAAALAWAIPSIIFWLPQPVPILRHYLLASLGLVVVAAALVLDRLSGPKLALATTVLVTGNLLVPEIAYRAYNASAAAGKTPHGAFFYYHGEAARRIAANNDLARRIVSCRSATDGPAKSCSLVRWEMLAHVAYAAATCSEPVVPEPTEVFFPGTRYVRFRIGEGEARLISYVYFEDDSLRAMAARIMSESRDAGFCLFAPRALCDSTQQLQLLRGAIDCY